MTFLSATAHATSTPTGLSLPLTGGFTLRVDILSDWLVRTAIVPEGGLTVDRTWMIAPDGVLLKLRLAPMLALATPPPVWLANRPAVAGGGGVPTAARRGGSGRPGRGSGRSRRAGRPRSPTRRSRGSVPRAASPRGAADGCRRDPNTLSHPCSGHRHDQPQARDSARFHTA